MVVECVFITVGPNTWSLLKREGLCELLFIGSECRAHSYPIQQHLTEESLLPSSPTPAEVRERSARKTCPLAAANLHE